jgi:hypothetical protein
MVKTATVSDLDLAPLPSSNRPSQEVVAMESIILIDSDICQVSGIAGIDSLLRYQYRSNTTPDQLAFTMLTRATLERRIMGTLLGYIGLAPKSASQATMLGSSKGAKFP